MVIPHTGSTTSDPAGDSPSCACDAAWLLMFTGNWTRGGTARFNCRRLRVAAPCSRSGRMRAVSACSMPLRLFVRRALIYTHRWTGIVLGALFIAWFASGVVLMYAQMPRLSRADRLARLPLLDFHTAAVTPADAAAAVGYGVRTVRLGMFGGRPIYRLAGAEGSATVYADDGSELEP